MTDDNNNKSKEYGIDKFEGSFDKEELGVTIIPNQSINEITNPESLGLYIYLLARPKKWQLNVKHLSDHFKCGEDKMYGMLNYLLQEKFISKTIIRNKGKFVKHHYRVHLSRFEPLPEKPDVVQPDVENPDTYKTKNLPSKEVILKPYVDSKSTAKPKEYKEDLLFMEFYKLYPNKQKPTIAYKAFLKHMPTPEFVAMLITDLMERIEGNWKGRDKSKIPFPATYLNGREWEGEIYDNVVSTVKKSTKYKTWDEIVGDVA
jgi:hypothetical protein